MNELTCDVCMDLLPLVRDGIASPDSEEAVRRHLAHCEQCRALYGGGTPPPAPDAAAAWQTMRRQLRLFSAMLLMFGLVFGLSLSGSGELFYNVVLMPVLGAVGYGLFRWKALYRVPALLAGTLLVMAWLGLAWQGEDMGLAALLLWSGIYGLFALLGTLIAGLFHFALKKEK